MSEKTKDFFKKIIYVLVVFLVIDKCKCLDLTGPTNRFYSIPFFYGSRVKDWNNTMSYYQDRPV